MPDNLDIEALAAMGDDEFERFFLALPSRKSAELMLLLIRAVADSREEATETNKRMNRRTLPLFKMGG